MVASPFSPVKGKFGFGCMRLPMKLGVVDEAQVSEMVDTFLNAGFNYFDTAHGYIEGMSELAIKHCLAERHPRSSYLLADKLTANFFNKAEDVRAVFDKQLDACGVSYFDYYLMHAQGKSNFAHFQACKAYETAFQLKAEGKIRHVGISFHDTPEMLEEILSCYPDVEFVQIQLNYVDWDDVVVQSRKCYEVCVRHQKEVVVMEPVKGGSLVNLPPKGKAIIDDLHGGSPASYAIRFAASLPQVRVVLSGMSDLAQMKENVAFMQDMRPLDDSEKQALSAVCQLFRSLDLIPCTACRYCVDGCPKHVAIPDLFACMNSKKRFEDWNQDYYYHSVLHSKASDCIRCGKCERVCPQHLPIRELLQQVAHQFE